MTWVEGTVLNTLLEQRRGTVSVYDKVHVVDPEDVIFDPVRLYPVRREFEPVIVGRASIRLEEGRLVATADVDLEALGLRDTFSLGTVTSNGFRTAGKQQVLSIGTTTRNSDSTVPPFKLADPPAQEILDKITVINALRDEIIQAAVPGDVYDPSEPLWYDPDAPDPEHDRAVNAIMDPILALAVSVALDPEDLEGLCSILEADSLRRAAFVRSLKEPFQEDGVPRGWKPLSEMGRGCHGCGRPGPDCHGACGE